MSIDRRRLPLRAWMLPLLCSVVTLTAQAATAEAASAQAATARAPVAAAAARASQLIPVCVTAHFHACGLLDRSGNWVVEPRYSEIYENGPYWTVERYSGLVGLLAADGSELIAPSFDYIGHFVGGIAAATMPGPRNTLSGYIDSRGNWQIQPKFLYTPEFNGATVLAWLGPDYEHRRLVLLGRNGDMKFLAYDEDISAVDGRYIVGRGKADVRDCAGLDADANVLLPFVKGCSLTIVRGAGWLQNDVAVGRERRQSRVLDRQGRVLARIDGEDPWISEPDSEGIAQFSPDGSREGLLDVRTGKVLLKPAQRSIINVGDGRVAFGAYESGVSRYGYMDYRGRVIVPPRYAMAGVFASGYAAVQLQPGASGANAVIDLQGREVPAFAPLHPEAIELDPWGDGPQSPLRRDVARVTSGRASYLTTLQGSVIATLDTDAECGAQTLRNAAGKLIWPHHPSASCAVRNGDEPDEKSTADFRAAYQEHLAYETQLSRERARIDVQGGGLLNMIDPQRAERQAAIDAAHWVRAPSAIQLGRTVSLDLPEGYRFLPSAALAALKDRSLLGPPAPAGLGVLEAPDGRWRAFVGAVDSGYVSLAIPLASSDDLLTLLHARRFGLFAPRAQEHMGAFINLRWQVQPIVDVKRSRLFYAFEYTNFENGDRRRYMEVVKFGRSQSVLLMVEFAGLLTLDHIDQYQGEILGAMDGVRFIEHERHEDAPAAEARPTLKLQDFVTGGPTEKERRFLQNLEEQGDPFSRKNLSRYFGRIAGLLGLLLSLGFWRVSTGKREPRA